uniref:Uncharacterized protein n=1 Tax=Geladintestivirus 1 TaxID=3233133 RepID=A0AAU8MLC0_9CAUD
MEDIQVLNELIDTSIRNSSYVSVLISSCIFILYSLMNKLIEYFKQRDRNRPIIEMASAIKDVSDNVVKLNSVLSKTFEDTQKKEIIKCKTAITLAFNTLQNKISNECIDMIIHNHIEENKQLITENVHKLISTEYYKVYATLSNYEIDGINVASKLDKEWIDELCQSILSIMYNGQDSTLRIVQLNNRLNVDINNYSTYTHNKIFSD